MGPMRPLNEHNTLHFDNEEDIHTSSKSYEESGCGHQFDLLNAFH